MKRSLVGLVLMVFMPSTSLLWAEDRLDSNCIHLQTIETNEHLIWTLYEQAALLDKYHHQCINRELLKNIMADISSFYMAKGYVTTRAYLQPQNIQDGHLKISVLQGLVEDIIDDKSRTSSASIQTAFALQKNKLLNLRDLETALEMVNRPASSDASFSIKPGLQVGGSIVEVHQNKSIPVYHLKLGLGGRQNLNDKNLYMTGEFILDNPLHINDILKLNYNGSRVQKVYQSQNGLEVNYSFPIGSYLIELVGTDFIYRQGVNGMRDTYLSSGDTQGLQWRVNKVLWRNQQHKLNAGLAIGYKDTKNYFSNQVLDVSSYKTTQVEADLSHTYIASWGQLSSLYSYYQGVDWFGARSDGYLSAETGLANNQAKLQFVKHSVDGNLLYYIVKQSFKLSSNAHIQFSNDLLYDNDKLTVGSDYTVRGYASPSLYGNNAWYIKNDLIKTWNIKLKPAILQSLSLSVGMDYGEVSCESDNQSSCGNIKGMAVGFSTQGKHLSSHFVWSKPLKKISPTSSLNGLFDFDVIWIF